MSNRLNKANKLTDGPTSIFIAGEDDELKEEMQRCYSVRTMPAPARSKQEKLIYSQLEQYCDFIFCQSVEQYLFYSKEQFNIFAKDKDGGVYGFIGGTGDLQDDNYPIGYVCSEGKSDKIANSFKELLALVIYYPFWMDLLKLHKDDIHSGIEELEKERLEDMPDYYKVQQSLGDNLGIKKQEYSIGGLFNCLSEEPKFIVYSTVDNNPSDNLLK
jgi:hypothetical protein